MKRHIHIPLTERELLVEGVVLLKIGIMAGMIAVYFFPAEHAIWVSLATNFLWLWKV